MTYATEWAQSAPQDSEVLCILRHVSQSGMTRVISLAVIDNGDIRFLGSLDQDPRWPFRWDSKRSGWIVRGAGMDMGFHLAYTLGQTFHGDGYYFRSRWI